MKKGYYLYAEGCGSSGVLKKIEMQTHAFAQHFDIQAIQINTINCSILMRIYNLFPWASYMRDYDSSINQMNEPDFVYIRRMYVDREYLGFLNTVHEKWPKCKIIVEQPVYPYKRDMLSTPYTAIQYLKELLYRKYYKDNIDRFVTYSNADEILGVPTIRTMNGINTDEIETVNTSLEYDEEGINIIAVATLFPHHGYERIIEGLYQYFRAGGKRKIKFHIVGDGPEKSKYEKLVEAYQLQECVLFYGAKYGDELEGIYAKADVGAAALGVYRDGLDYQCAIKTREYLAKGIPVIIAGEDSIFCGDNAKYAIEFPNDSSPINIDELIEYLDGLYVKNGRKSSIEEVARIAKNTVDNRVTLLPVIEYIDNKE